MSRSISPDRVPLLQDNDDDWTPDLSEASDVANTISPRQSIDVASTVSLRQFAGAASTVSPSGPVDVNATAMSSTERVDSSASSMSSNEPAGVADQLSSGHSRENKPASLLVVSTTEIFMLICDHLSNGSNKKVLRNLMLCSKTTSIAVDYLWGRHHVRDIYPLLRLLPVKAEKNSGKWVLTWEDSGAKDRAGQCHDRILHYANKVERLDLMHGILPRGVQAEETMLDGLFGDFLAADNDQPFFPRLKEILAAPFDELKFLRVFALGKVPLNCIHRIGSAAFNPISSVNGEGRWPSPWMDNLKEIQVCDLTQAELEATTQIASLKVLTIENQRESLTVRDREGPKFSLTTLKVRCPFKNLELVLAFVPPGCKSVKSCSLRIDLPDPPKSPAPRDATIDIIIQRLADRLNSSTKLQMLVVETFENVTSEAEETVKDSLTNAGLRPWAKFSALHTLHIAIDGEVAIDNDSLVKLTLPLQNLGDLALTGGTTSRTTPDVLPPLIKSLKNLKSLELGFNIGGFRGDNGRSPDDIPEHIDLDREITLNIDPECSSQIGEHHERLFNFLARILPGEQHYIGLSEWEVYPEWDDLVDRHIKQRKARYGSQADLYGFSWDDARKGMEYP